MAKKSPILAVNESENKASRKRPAVRQTTGRRKTASGKPSGRKTPKGKKKSANGKCLPGAIISCWEE